MKDNYSRFTDKVQDYIKYRPQYPEQVFAFIEKQFGIDNRGIVADIGSGTGISTEPFLKKGYAVYGVEPNAEMRDAAKELLQDYPNFKSIDGTAENTTLDSSSVDLVYCGQSFHWFDMEVCKKEFQRILKENGNVALVWNERDPDAPLIQEYEKILFDLIPEYTYVHHRDMDKDALAPFYAPKEIQVYIVNNPQYYTLDEMKGRLRSSSFAPKGGKELDKVLLAIEQLFAKYEKDDVVEFSYKTMVYYA